MTCSTYSRHRLAGPAQTKVGAIMEGEWQQLRDEFRRIMEQTRGTKDPPWARFFGQCSKTERPVTTVEIHGGDRYSVAKLHNLAARAGQLLTPADLDTKEAAANRLPQAIANDPETCWLVFVASVGGLSEMTITAY